MSFAETVVLGLDRAGTLADLPQQRRRGGGGVPLAHPAGVQFTGQVDLRGVHQPPHPFQGLRQRQQFLVGQALHGAELVLGTIALSLATFMNVLDTSIANVSIPAIAGDMGVSPSQGTWVITSFAVANAISVPLTGWLTQRFGPVRLFVGSILLFVIASWLCGLAPNIGMLIAFRVLQGFVAGPMIPLSQTLLLSSYPRAKAGTAMAMWAMTVLVAPVAGPLLGGWITDNISWPWIFYINIPVGLIAAAIEAVGPNRARIRDWLAGLDGRLVDERPEGAAEVGYAVEEGVISLDGKVISLSHKRVAGVLAWWTAGCRDVVNSIEIDPPAHHGYRRILNPHFTPKALRDLGLQVGIPREAPGAGRAPAASGAEPSPADPVAPTRVNPGIAVGEPMPIDGHRPLLHAHHAGEASARLCGARMR